MKTTTMMMTLVLGMTFMFASCRKEVWGVKGKGPVKTEQRYESGFTGIEMEIDAEVILVQDSVYSIEVSAQQNILEVLRTKVEYNTLIIEYDRRVRDHKPIKLIIHTPEISRLELAGSGNIKAAGPIKTTYLETEITGSGNMDLNELICNEHRGEITGSGNLTVNAGNVNWADLEITGSGNMYLSGMTVEKAKIQITGSGNAEIYATQSLMVRITGSGSVFYLGSPSMDLEITGSGGVQHL